MHDDSEDPEQPARADVPLSDYLAADGRTAWVELTAFQRDCLESIARLERDDVPPDDGSACQTLERSYPGVSRTRLEPNLRVLVGRGLVDAGALEARTTEYPLTDAGRALLVQRAERLADVCEISFAATGSGTTETAPREGGDG